MSVARVDIVEIRWRPWPAGHVTVAKPPRCTVGDCKLTPWRWARCSCGRWFAACGGPHHLHDVPAELEAHRRTCPAPRATDMTGPGR